LFIKDPLFDENVLNELCLSDELWANLNLPLPAPVDQEMPSVNPGPDKGIYTIFLDMSYYNAVYIISAMYIV